MQVRTDNSMVIQQCYAARASIENGIRPTSDNSLAVSSRRFEGQSETEMGPSLVQQQYNSQYPIAMFRHVRCCATAQLCHDFTDEEADMKWDENVSAAILRQTPLGSQELCMAHKSYHKSDASPTRAMP